MTESALYRLLLNPTVAGRSFTAADVTAVLVGIRSDPRWRWLPDDSSLADPVIGTGVLMGHGQVTDLHLVNLAARHHARLVTFDARLLAGLAPPDRRHVQLLTP